MSECFFQSHEQNRQKMLIPKKRRFSKMGRKKQNPLMEFRKQFPPTCPDVPLDWLACDCRPAPGPAPTDGCHGEVVHSPREHPPQDAAGQVHLCDGQAVWRSPLQAEVVVVPGGGTPPRQLYRVIGRALFDGQVRGRLWSWSDKNNISCQCSNCESVTNYSAVCTDRSVPTLRRYWTVLRCV